MSVKNPTLRTSGLTVHYGERRAIDAVSVDCYAGEICCVLGPNGAGKSTLMKAIGGSVPVTSGKVLLKGNDVTGDPDSMVGSISIAPQEARVFAGLTPTETLSFAGTMRGLAGDELRAELDHLLSVMQLNRESKTLARDLSGGMVRKLAVASALIGARSLILLDESFAGLDPEAVRLVEQELRRTADRGVAIVLVTHRLDLVQRIGDRMFMLFDGRLTREWTSAEYRSEIEGLGGDPNELYLACVERCRRSEPNPS